MRQRESAAEVSVADSFKCLPEHFVQLGLQRFGACSEFSVKKAAFDTLISGRKCQLIIPKSLLSAVAVDSTFADVRVDESC